MKRKNISRIIISAAIALSTTACSNYIDIEPENKLPQTGLDYTKTEDMYKPVISVYAQVRNSGCHWANALLLFTHDGDVWSGRTDDQAAAADFGRKFIYDNGFWALNNVWVTMYEIIRTANSALESLDGYSQFATDKSTYESYCGEVRTLRAWAYYQLVTHFGPCVIYKDNKQTDFHRSTVQTVYKYMLEDLTYAMERCPKLRPNEMRHMGAVSAYTAETIAAQVALLKGDYSAVETYTDDIISSQKFSLYNDYYNLFKIPGKLCNESLFEVQVSDFGQGSGDYVGVDQWFNFQGAGISDPVSGKSTGGWTFINYEPSFVKWAKERGETVRFETSFLLAGGTTKEGYSIGGDPASDKCWNGKAYLPIDQMTEGNTEYGRNNNVRILRYAEVLLMNAEAKIRNGKNGDSPLNLVRDRAQMRAITNATVENVLDERRIELCSEWSNARYNDLVRTNLAEKVLGPQGWDKSKTYWPIPYSQIQDIPELLEEPIDE